MITLEYKTRDVKDDLSQLRKDGFIPAVFYGKKQKSTPISVVSSDFLKVWKHAGESEVVSLKSRGPSSVSSENVNTLIHEVAVNPLSGIPLHADFYVFEKGKKIEVSIPLEFVGVSPAIKDLGGNLVKVLHEIKVSASPEHLPHQLDVDISSLLTFDDHISAKNITLPTGVDLALDGETVVASISAPKAEEVEEPTIAPDLSAIEVEKKGKKEEEGEVEGEVKDPVEAKTK